MTDNVINFPAQALSRNRKTKKWGEQCVLWAKNKATFNYSPVMKSVIHKKINYDLVNGKIHMKDLQLILNPNGIQANYLPEQIQHYSIINSKLDLLRGEEAKRAFDFKVVITNPNAISEIEDRKKQAMLYDMQQLIQNQQLSEEEFNAQTQKINDYYMYDWQDMKEIAANAILNHYIKEYNIPSKFTQGFMDALIVGEEIYQCDIVGGEPVIQKINPQKIRIYKSGYSNRIEDADIIVLEDYWSPGKIIDTYYDVLTDKDIKKIENYGKNIFGGGYADKMDNIDERPGIVNMHMITDQFDKEKLFDDVGEAWVGIDHTLCPYDMAGNIRVLRVYWKSMKKIKKVKSYDPMTGDERYEFYSEKYMPNEDMGEEEQIYWVNEAWEGTLIGDDIFVNVRPRPVQYNSLSNPSRCHFGIVGQIYNLNDDKPFSMVDMMKPDAYLYDVIHERLNHLLSINWGKLAKVDLSLIPKGWTFDKWMYYARVNGIAIIDSFNEGDYGAGAGKLAGAMNNNSNGVIDAELGDSIQQYINLLEYIKSDLSDISGISKQREGQISNRETVGGVERATLQSSHITEWLFQMHDDVRKRTLECFLETAKIAYKGRTKKFQYIMSDNSIKILDIDGNDFSEADYGLVVDGSNRIADLQNKIETLAQAAMQNGMLNFSTMLKLWNSCSLAEKQRMVEKDETQIRQQQQQMQEQQLQQQQQIAQMQIEQKNAQMQLENDMNDRDNQTRIIVAEIAAQAKVNDADGDGIDVDGNKEELMEKMRQFDEKLKLEREKMKQQKTIADEQLQFNRDKLDVDSKLKEKQINKQNKNTSK